MFLPNDSDDNGTELNDRFIQLMFRRTQNTNCFCLGFSIRYLMAKKPVSVKCVVTKDLVRTLTSELSQGSLGTKITSKRSLEAVISTSLERIGRGVSRRCS